MDNEKPDAPQNAGQEDPTHDQTQALIVVGVGASAGGLEAFTELLKHLPATTGLAFVLVQHLDPHHESVLSELLAAKTPMRVTQVQREMPIRPDHVYVIPPNTIMRVHDGSFVLEARPASQDAFRPIDILFYSLAEEFHYNAVGIVLSGTASDGTLGLKAIKAEGGITFAQNQTAKFDSMPRSAIAAGAVDFILPPRRIAEELISISRRSPGGRAAETLVGDGTTLHRLLLLLRNNTGVDFTQYKQPTILRRLHRRMVVRKVEKPEEYLALLHRDAGEAKALFDDLLINVTDFFRDPDVFEQAKRVAFPSITRDRKQSNAIRVWVPGCSTGEEVYSTAIALMEFLESEDLECGIQIFGTDVSETTIEKARIGIYGNSAVLNVSPERLRRFFVKTDSGYQINRTIREMCIFSRHNVAKDPPLSKMDLISCRNLLIYFSPSLQKRIIATFGYALQPNGCLILGSSETLGALAEYFLVLDEKHKIFCRKAEVARSVFQIVDADGEFMPAVATPVASRQPDQASLSGTVHRFVDQIVLSRLGPVGMVVNEALKITEYRGDVAEHLVTDAREPNADLMQSLRPDLRASISTAIEQARRTRAAVVVDNLPASSPDNPHPLTIAVVPILLIGTPLHFLILIGRNSESIGVFADKAGLETDDQSAGPMSLEDENTRLKQELKSTREYLQSVIEELRSTNEEAQSANEELQSTNEEMQTSKEELQSSNEELNTINTEMQSRNAELKQVNDDLINLLASMNMPIVMTGNDLRIRRFTPIAEKALRLIATDIGRPITDLKPRINVPDLDGILQRVLDTLQPYEQEVYDQEGHSYLMRVRPYRTSDHRIDGTVLQLLDVTDLNRSLEEVKHARDFAEAIVNTVREPLVVLNENNVIQNANRSFYETLDLPPVATQGATIFEVARGRFDLPQIRALLDKLNQGASELNDIEVTHQRNGGENRILLLNARRLRPPTDHKHLILMAFEDITERKRAAEARYRQLFESARDGIVLVDAESGHILDLNPFAEHLFGYRRDEVVGRTVWEIEVMQNVPTMRATIHRVRDQGAFRIDDFVLRNKDGRDIQVEVIASQYFEGDRVAIQLNMRDVSEHKKFERELQESQRLESLGLLAGGIAHDFNNLLTGIMGNASLGISETSADEPVRVRLREIVNASERAAFLTRQMLAYAGRGRFVTTVIDLKEFIREISALLRMSVPKSVEIDLDLAPDLPLIEGDPSQIQQVIMNLIINGAEAIGETKPGKVSVRVSTRKLSGREVTGFSPRGRLIPGTYIQIEVIDTGHGMDDATKARIFDPFFTTKFLGRGLGLAAVQGIVKGHGGAINVYSTPGQGTTFVVLLPANRDVKRDQPQTAPGSRAIPTGSVALVIDDEQPIRTLAEDVLSRAGMKVLTAENGGIGVEMFRQHHRIISVVLLDLLMPGMGGEEALKRLQQINPEVPVILSSGFDETEARQKFASLGQAYFLQKPYTAERLTHAIADSLTDKERE